MTLNRADIVSIAKKKKEGKTAEEIAEELKVSVATVRRWTRRLKEAGYEIPKTKTGRPKMEL